MRERAKSTREHERERLRAKHEREREPSMRERLSLLSMRERAKHEREKELSMRESSLQPHAAVAGCTVRDGTTLNDPPAAYL